jgi:cytochrome P450 PksS
MDVGGVTLQKGDFAMLLVASANHDPDEFEDPESFDVGRSPNNHLGFGFGIHHCLGAPLARMEAQVALTSLIRRAPDLTLAGGQGGNAGEKIAYKTNVVLRGMEALSVSMRG